MFAFLLKSHAILSKNIKHKTMKTILLALALIVASTSTAFSITPPSDDDDKVQIHCNSATGNASIVWSDTRIEFIEIVASNGQFMPTIPVSDAKSLHMNDLMNGTYTLIFKTSSEELYRKAIVVNK